MPEPDITLTQDKAINPLQPIAVRQQPDLQISQRRVLAVYKQMLVSLFVATLLVILMLIVLIMPFFIRYYFYEQADAHSPPLLPVIALAGALGAFFSMLMRLYTFEDLPKVLVSSDLDGLPAIHLVIYSLVPAVVGAIAAAVLYMLFASEVIQSDLFPKFACKKPDCNSFAMLIGEWSPNRASDYAKSIVWGFIGGFAERLVPDTLQGISQSAKKGSS
jgi:hypothetical protein